jgi:hypothetical protein
VNKYFNGSPVRVVALILAAITVTTCEAVVHSISAGAYYDANQVRLQMVADSAARSGAEYLPAAPRAAVKAAEEFAQNNGVLSGEITYAQVAPDGNTLNIRLHRQIPIYIALFAVGLRSREITVAASAQKRTDNLRTALIKGDSRDLDV